MDDNRVNSESLDGDIRYMNNINRLRRQRQASATLIAGLIGTAVIAITVLASYSSSLLDENAKMAGQLAAGEDDRNMSSEKMIVTKYPELSNGESKNIKIRISNDGPLISAYQHVLLYCLSDGCPTNPGAPVVNPLSVVPAPPIAMAPGEAKEIQVGPVTDGLTYRVDIVTERGNIVSAGECTTDFSKQSCEGPIEVVENQ